MRLAFEPTPDHPTVQAVTYGPVVLSGVYPADPGPLTPALEHRLGPADRRPADDLRGAVADGKPVTLIPVSRAAHEYYTVYWQTA